MRPGDPFQLEATAGWDERATWSRIESRIRRGRRIHRLAIAVAVASAFLAGLLAAPRSSAVNLAGAWGLPSEGQRTSGAPLPQGFDHVPATQRPSSGVEGSGAPSPTGGIGEPATAVNPDLTPPATVSRGTLAGQATWWDSFGPGLYAAIRPDLGTKGDLAVVCGPILPSGIVSTRGYRFHCRTVPVTTTCACLGPGSDRLIDLSLDTFAEFAEPSDGVVRITLQVLDQ